MYVYVCLGSPALLRAAACVVARCGSVGTVANACLWRAFELSGCGDRGAEETLETNR